MRSPIEILIDQATGFENANGWRDMSTAPKDGKGILGGVWLKDDVFWVETIFWDGKNWADITGDKPQTPLTYWQPWPDPPKAD